MDDWPPGRPRILVTDAWLANAGDGAIALATERRLRRLAPGAAILHAAYQGDLLAAAYPDLALVPPLSALLGAYAAIPEMAGWDLRRGEALVDSSDVVFSQGGGFALEHYAPWTRVHAWELAVQRGRPLGFGAQTIGPFREERYRESMRRAYGEAVVIALREEESVPNVLDLGGRMEQIAVTADEVFGFFTPPGPGGPDPCGTACVLSQHPQLRSDGTLARPGGSLRELSDLVAGLVRAFPGEPVTLLSTQQGLGHLDRGLEDDALLAARVLAALPVAIAAQVQTVRGYLGPERFASEIARHRRLVSMRMHPAIIGLSLGVPTLLLNDGFKARAMFESLDLGVCLGEAEDAISRGRYTQPDLSRARARAAANDDVVLRLLAAA